MYTFLATHTFERKKRNAITRYRSCSPKRDTQRCHAVFDKREKRPLKIVTICHITILQKGVGITKGKYLVYQKSFEICLIRKLTRHPKSEIILELNCFENRHLGVQKWGPFRSRDLGYEFSLSIDRILSRWIKTWSFL